MTHIYVIFILHLNFEEELKKDTLL